VIRENEREFAAEKQKKLAFGHKLKNAKCQNNNLSAAK